MGSLARWNTRYSCLIPTGRSRVLAPLVSAVSGGEAGLEGDGFTCHICGNFQETKAWLEEHLQSEHGGHQQVGNPLSQVQASREEGRGVLGRLKEGGGRLREEVMLPIKTTLALIHLFYLIYSHLFL